MTTKEDIYALEKKLTEITEINNKHLKEKKNLELTTEYLTVTYINTDIDIINIYINTINTINTTLSLN